MYEGPGKDRFVGRAGELDLLRAAWRTVLDGQSVTVVISGDRGVGKSTLALESLAAATAAGFLVATGQCTPAGDAAPPGWPFRDALRSAGTAAIGDGHLFDEVRNALVAASRHQPLAVLIEDLHWADESSSRLVSFLAGALHDERVLLVSTLRTDEALGSTLRQVLSELRRSRQARFVDLVPFTRAEIALLAGLDGHGQAALVDAVWRRSGGNAFLAEALIRAIASGSTAVPPELRDVLVGRFDQLSPAARDVARAVAVGGEIVDHWVLAELDVLGDEDLAAPLRECVASQVLTVADDRDAYRFKDPLLEELVYADLLPGERTRLHRAYGQVLEAHVHRLDGGAAEKLAHHWYGAGVLSRAQEAALEVAGRAEARRDFATALREYERAIEIEGLLPLVDAGTRGGTDRSRLFSRAAEVAHLAGEHRRASHLISLAADTPPEAGATDLLLHPRLVRYLCASGASRQALAAADEVAGSAVAGIPLTERAQFAAARAEALRLAGRYEDARLEATEALELAHRGGDQTSVQTQILGTLGHAVAMLGDDATAVLTLERARDLAEAAARPEEVARSHLNLAELLAGPAGRPDAAVEVAEMGVRRCVELGLERSYGAALRAIAVNTRFELGRWDEADAILDEAFSCDPTGAAAIELRLARARLLVGRGELVAAVDDLDAVRALTVDAIGPRYKVPLLTLRAALAMWQRRPDYARMAVAEALEDESVQGDVRLLAPLLWHGLRAEADRIALAWSRRSPDQHDETARHADELLARAELLHAHAGSGAAPVRDEVEAHALLCRAEYGRLDGSSPAETWVSAASAFERLGRPYIVAYARWHEAEARLGRRSRDTAATAALAGAHDIACTLGAQPLRREIEELAARARIELHPAVRPPTGGPGPDPATGPVAAHDALRGLTARELDVLRLVAQGRSNREIGDELFISQKTVSVHVSRILAKLGVRTRVQATALVHQLETAD